MRVPVINMFQLTLLIFKGSVRPARFARNDSQSEQIPDKRYKLPKNG